MQTAEKGKEADPSPLRILISLHSPWTGDLALVLLRPSLRPSLSRSSLPYPLISLLSPVTDEHAT
eukprot:95272-Hanusia_phi.AAC.1